MAEDNRAQGLAWFLAGIGIGALVGILYAPKSGRETREDIAQGAREGSEYLRSKRSKLHVKSAPWWTRARNSLVTMSIVAVKSWTVGGPSGKSLSSAARAW